MKGWMALCDSDSHWHVHRDLNQNGISLTHPTTVCMTPRLMLGLGFVAALGGAVLAGVLHESTPTASASAPTSGYGGSDGERRYADIYCIITIRESSVEGSNLCTDDSDARHTTLPARKNDHGGADGYTPPTNGHDSRKSHDGGDKEECEAEGLVNVQTCDVIEDSFNNVLNHNDVLSDNEILKDVIHKSDVDVLEDIVENSDVDILEDIIEDSTIRDSAVEVLDEAITVVDLV